MKFDKSLISVSLSVGILAGLWQVLVSVIPADFAIPLGGVGVAGFLGWATFYAAGGKKDGLVKGSAANLTGVIWAMVIVLIMQLFNFNLLGAFLGVAVGAFMMCFQAHIKLLGFIPGAFIGCSTLFALGATITDVVLWPTIIGLLAGLVLGFISEWLGGLINKYIIK